MLPAVYYGNQVSSACVLAAEGAEGDSRGYRDTTGRVRHAEHEQGCLRRGTAGPPLHDSLLSRLVESPGAHYTHTYVPWLVTKARAQIVEFAFSAVAAAVVVVLLLLSL